MRRKTIEDTLGTWCTPSNLLLGLPGRGRSRQGRQVVRPGAAWAAWGMSSRGYPTGIILSIFIDLLLRIVIGATLPIYLIQVSSSTDDLLVWVATSGIYTNGAVLLKLLYIEIAEQRYKRQSSHKGKQWREDRHSQQLKQPEHVRTPIILQWTTLGHSANC